MTHGRTSLQTAIVAIVLGIAVCPASLYLFMSSGSDTWVSSLDYSLVATSALPFLASIVVLAITKESRLAIWSALVPLVASICVHLLVAASVRSDPLAGILLGPFAWLNFLLFFPLGLWAGFRALKKHGHTEEPSNTSLERTRGR